ncbi:calmodulin-like [Actinia tenebrosa]|uniref:Calmodulin-like n=1 Tax=Actinia tenebrosa TaxID=6105 RepID=A0A6P8HFB7_ACTTE|nr:calmodulin-like [Actinia tenebrosa]
MLRRHVSSIAEEPEEEEQEKTKSKDKIASLTPVEEATTPTDDKPIPHRSSTKSSELTILTENTLDESGSEQLSADEEEDVFDELNESANRPAKRNGLQFEKRRDTASPASPSPESGKNDVDLTEDQVREIKEAFLVFDDNGDGCISATELKKLVTSLGYNITEAELMDMMNQIDSDGNGAIDFPEFLTLMSRNLQDTDPEDIMMESFKVFDRDNNGSIGADELQRVMRLLGQDFRDHEIESMIKGADFDNDGKVGYEDFQRMMNT